MQKVLEIQNLTFGYSKNRLLYQNFNLNLNRGEIVSIVGESGSGKSTLFELIIGELKPISGTIDSQKATYIFQDPYSSFHNSYSIKNQIEDVAELQKLDSFLQPLNLSKELLDKKPFELSGGQLQRCSILRAILMDRELILADEITSALDNITSLEVMKMLMTLQKSILLITHDLALAKWCSDKIINLNEQK